MIKELFSITSVMAVIATTETANSTLWLACSLGLLGVNLLVWRVGRG